METDAVDERPPSASPASPTRKEKRNDAAMGKATPRAPRSADLGRCRLPSDGCVPSPAGGLGEGAGGSITWMGDPSLGCRRSPDPDAGDGGGSGCNWAQRLWTCGFLGLWWPQTLQDYFGPYVPWASGLPCSMPSLDKHILATLPLCEKQEWYEPTRASKKRYVWIC